MGYLALLSRPQTVSAVWKRDQQPVEKWSSLAGPAGPATSPVVYLPNVKFNLEAVFWCSRGSFCVWYPLTKFIWWLSAFCREWWSEKLWPTHISTQQAEIFPQISLGSTTYGLSSPSILMYCATHVHLLCMVIFWQYNRAAGRLLDVGS